MTKPEPPNERRQGGRDSLDFMGDRVVASAMRRFVIGSVLALVAVTLGIYLVGHRVAQQQALKDAEDRARRLSLTVGELVTDDVRAGRPGAGQALDRLLRGGFEEGVLRRAKIWTESGEVLWSDQEELVGKRYPMAEEDRALFGTTEVHAEVSRLDDPENAAERAAGEMLEVYAGSFDAEGRPLVFEAYLSTDQMRDDQNAIIAAFMPVGIVGLLLFQAAVLPLAVSLGRRVHHSEESRIRLTAQALQASELERKRIAQELHDGVVQDLAGVGFSLPGVRRALRAAPDGDRAARTVQELEAVIHRDIAALRSMMIDVYPPDLEQTGLVEAVEDLAAAGRARGLDVEVTGIGDLSKSLPTDCARLAYRVAREGLHNVLKHAHARTASVTIERRPDALVVSVCDDGVGLPADPARSGKSLGLKLLAEAVHESKGELRLVGKPADRSCPGTLLEAVLRLPTGGGAGWAVQGSSKRPSSWLLGRNRSGHAQASREPHVTEARQRRS